MNLLQKLPVRSRFINGYVNYSRKSIEPTEYPKKESDDNVTKDSLQWRKEWANKEGHWYSKFKVFSSEENSVDIIKFFQTKIDLSPSVVKAWWVDRQLEKEKMMQAYIPERNQILGNDLAAAHFLVHRQGAVKFYGENEWVKQDEDGEYKLPNLFVAGKIVEAIDCSGMNLHYEGLDNLRGLKKMNWLSINKCQYMDDWCMDRISSIFRDTLTYLDIRNCPKITDRGIGVLYRATNLKTLYVDNKTASVSIELTCLMLQELLPELQIKEE